MASWETPTTREVFNGKSSNYMGYWRVNPTIEGREHGIVVSTTRGFQTAMNSNSNEPEGKTTCHIPTAKAGWNIARASSPSLFHRWHDYSPYALHPKTSRLTNGFSPFVQPSCNANTWCSKSHEPKNRMVGKMGNYYSSPHVGKIYFQKVGLPINLHIFPTWGFP
jgi:hypothetical protein